MKSKCQWCGSTFEKYHGNEKYCSSYCIEKAKQEQNRKNFHRWYHKHKKELDNLTRYGLGSGTLSHHRRKNFKEEQKTIKREKQRLIRKGVRIK